MVLYSVTLTFCIVESKDPRNFYKGIEREECEVGSIKEAYLLRHEL